LYNENDEKRLRAVQVLGLLNAGQKVREVVSEMVKDKDQKVRATSVHLLGKLVQRKDMNLVVALLNDRDIRVRANTIEALERIGNPSAAALLHRFRKDPSNRIRGNTLKALWNLGVRDILDDLKVMILHVSHLMRASGAWVMGEIGKDNPEIIELIARVVQDEDKLARENAIRAQLKIGGEMAEKYLKYLCEEEEVQDVKNKMKK
jgi:HEAT repeat protein